MGKWHLQKTKQCAKCPWRVDVDPYDIPDGYTVEGHAALASTIAEPGLLTLGAVSAMACHESRPGSETYCVGWLMHQLGPGNNLALRMQFFACANAGELETVGEQHECFADTLPYILPDW